MEKNLEIKTVLDLYPDQVEHIIYYTAKKLDVNAEYSKNEPTRVRFSGPITTLFSDYCLHSEYVDVVCYPFKDCNGKLHVCPRGLEIHHKEN